MLTQQGQDFFGLAGVPIIYSGSLRCRVARVTRCGRDRGLAQAPTLTVVKRQNELVGKVSEI